MIIKGVPVYYPSVTMMYEIWHPIFGENSDFSVLQHHPWVLDHGPEFPAQFDVVLHQPASHLTDPKSGEW